MTHSTTRTAERIGAAAKADATTTTLGWAAPDKSSPLEPVQFERRALRPHDVHIDIEFCGVCHSDLHQVRDEWPDTQPTQFPCLPGHEIVGRVAAVGEHVTKFSEGDRVGVGCIVDSCRDCEPCSRGLEQYCANEMTLTYNAPDRETEAITFGGYSQGVVVREEYVLRIPDALSSEAAAPILCAGVTTFSPLRHWRIGKGHKVGVVGIGGLGHMAIQLASALGAEVTAITTHAEKGDYTKELGATAVLDSTDDDAMGDAEMSFDFLLCTIPYAYDPNPYLELLALDGAMVTVGALVKLDPGPDGFNLAMGRRTLAGSIIGGIPETQEVLEFCAEHDIAPRTETIAMADINDAFEKMDAGDVRFRYVIDMATLDDEQGARTLDVDPK